MSGVVRTASGIGANQVLESCGSTNDLARELGERGAPHGSWISARAQEKGRGRLGRAWQSSEGNLFLSVIARIGEKRLWTWVPMATAVAVLRFLEKNHPSLRDRLRVKWPNDLWLVPAGAPPGASGAKLGGILCEAVGTRSGSFIVIGLGLNCLSAPEGLDQPTESLSGAVGAPVSAEEVRPGLVQSVVTTLDELASRGTAAIVGDYTRLAALPPGTEIEWVSPAGPGGSSGAAAPGATEAGHGRVQGLGSSGELIVARADGTELRLYADDVRVRKSASTSR